VTSLPSELYLFLLVELAAVAWLDLKYRKISNVWVILNIVLFIFAYFILKGRFVFQLQQMYYPFIFFIVGFAFYTLKIMGGGDSKFLVSIYLLTPLGFHEDFLFCLLYVTIIVGMSQFSYNTYVGRNHLSAFWRSRDVTYLKKCYGKKFPFAPIILLSWIIFGMNNILLIN